MTGADIRNARAALGELYGLGRPLRAAELGRLLRLQGRDPGKTVTRWEADQFPVSAIATVAIEMMLAGAIPPTWQDAIRK